MTTGDEGFPIRQLRLFPLISSHFPCLPQSMTKANAPTPIAFASSDKCRQRLSIAMNNVSSTSKGYFL
ncbi:hypothetical protein RJT34_14867 [Clitoria ternatea]|uniref:Uncharacterized protein n=1 Tax=Clitoria ternatea TaxID=43366 RepID=A0AAN9JR69_CLITE